MSEQVTKRPRAPYVSENAMRDWEQFKTGMKNILAVDLKKPRHSVAQEISNDKATGEPKK